MSRRSAATLAALLALLLMAQGCVYFNTFYLARRDFERAEALRRQAEVRETPLPQEALESYDRSLRFASRVLAEHPDSRYAEDSLVLSQKILFHRGAWTASLRKGLELATNYPDSPFLAESHLFNARCHLALGEPMDAVREAESAAAGLKGEDAVEARLTRAQALAAAGQHQEAGDALRAIAEDPSSPSDVVIEARLDLARMLEATGRYQEAARGLDRILEDPRTRSSVRLETLLHRISLHIMAGDQDLARQDLATLEALDATGFYAGIRRYYTGLMAAERGNTRQAVTELVLALQDGVTAEWEATIRMSLGRILTRTGEFSSVVPEYRAVMQGPGTQQQKQEAAERVDAILQLFALRSLAGRTETSVEFPDPRQMTQRAAPAGAGRRQEIVGRGLQEEVAAEGGQPSEEDLEALRRQAVEDVAPGLYLYLLAEHWEFAMSRPDSAIKYLDLLLKVHPASELVPRALYAKALWLSSEGGSEEQALRAAELLRSEFPSSRWTYYLEEDSEQAPPRPPELIAAERFGQVEELVDPLADPATWSSALPGLFEVADSFPGTEAARGALLQAAYLLERGAGTPDSARVVYQRISTEYPGTWEARIADAKITDGSLLFTEVDPVAERYLAMQTEREGWTRWFQQRQPARATRLQPTSRTIGAIGRPVAVPTEMGGRAGATGRPTRVEPPPDIPPDARRP